MQDSIFIAKFFRQPNDSLRIDGLINCFETAKKHVIDSGIDWDIISIYNEDSEKLISELHYRKDMFSKKTFFNLHNF